MANEKTLTTLLEVGTHTRINLTPTEAFNVLGEALYRVTGDERFKWVSCVKECRPNVFLIQPTEYEYYFVKWYNSHVDVVTKLPRLKWGYRIKTNIASPPNALIFAEEDKQTNEEDTTRYLISW